MINAISTFRKNINEASNLRSLHSYLEKSIVSPYKFDDLLRFEIVHSISALDKLMHDLIKIGMSEIFRGKRKETAKYLAEGISIETHKKLNNATIPPKEVIFEDIISSKLKIISFQDPIKIADGLSFIWEEKQKWQKIAASMATNDEIIKTTLKLIVGRRNNIVHEADINPTSKLKFSISAADTKNSTDFILKLGEAIYKNIPPASP
jgi:hypothetical protein